MNFELGVLGAGNMAEAIVRGAIDGGILTPDRIVLSDPDADRRRLFESLGTQVRASNRDAVADARHLLLAVKPQQLDAVASDLAAVDPKAQVVWSILAGVSTGKIERAAGRPLRVVRIMPNTPLLVGAGMSALAPGAHVREGDMELALQIFRAAGETVEVDESDLDAVTAVSGSGPAYVFYLAEAMEAAGRELGLGPDMAARLTRQTIHGAARLMLRSGGEPPRELRRKVTSPGGTTEAAVAHLDAHGAAEILQGAVQRSAERSRELGG